MGEIFAWIIGWDLILDMPSANAVAVGFGAYFNDLLDNVFGFHCRSSSATDFHSRANPPARGSTCPRFYVMLAYMAAGAEECGNRRAAKCHHSSPLR